MKDKECDALGCNKKPTQRFKTFIRGYQKEWILVVGSLKTDVGRSY